MADEKVNIVVKVITKTKQLDALMAKLAAVDKMENRLSSGKSLKNYANKTGNALSAASGRWKRHTDFVDTAIRGFGKGLTKFLGLAVKGVILEMGLLAAAMVVIHAAFIAGKFLQKAYHGGMTLLAGGAAAATVAISLMSAAMREQQAVMFAYRGKGAPGFGSAANQNAMAMRNLQMNTQLASLGVESLNSAYGVMSKTMKATQINASGKTLNSLMDFGSAGQDPKKAIEQVATVVAALNDEKKTIAQVVAEAKKLGPEMEKALKDGAIKTKAQFRDALTSGDLAKKGGVFGQFDAVNSTLMSQATKYFTLIKGKFADFGGQFLAPAKKAFEKIYNVISRDISRLMLSIQKNPGGESFISGLSSGIEKISNFFVKIIRDYLPKVQGSLSGIGNWLKSFTRAWTLFFDKLRPFIEGAKVVEKAFMQIWYAIKAGTENMYKMNDLLIANEETVIETGTRIGEIVRAVSDLLFNLKSTFFTILPFINDVLSGITMVVKMLTTMLTGLSSLGGKNGSFLKALAPLMAFKIFGGRMAGAAGKMMPTQTNMMNSVPTMSVTAGTVNINGRAVGSAALPGAAGAAGAGATGAGATSAAGAGGRLASGAGGPGGTGATPPPFIHGGPALSSMSSRALPFGTMNALTALNHPAILQDYKQKMEQEGPRGIASSYDKRNFGGGMAIGQAAYGSNLPTAMAFAGGGNIPQYVPSREFLKTGSTVGDAKYAQAMPGTIAGKVMKGGGRDPVTGRFVKAQTLGQTAVSQDIRHLGGAFVNSRGIPMSVGQHSQSLTSGVSFDGRVNLREAMSMGKFMKSGMQAGDNSRAGFDKRAFERQELLKSGGSNYTPVTGVHTPGMPAAAPGSANMVHSRTKGPDVDYSRMGVKRMEKLARARGLDTSGGADATFKALRQNDKDRMLAKAAVDAPAGSIARKSFENQMSSGFRSGVYETRYRVDKTTTAADGTKTTSTTYRDPGQTLRETLTKKQMKAASRAQDALATAGMAGRKTAGAYQGAMGYMNQGRYDATMNDGKGGIVDVQKMKRESFIRMHEQRGQALQFNEQTGKYEPAVGADGKPVGPTGMNRGKISTKLQNLRERARINRTETRFGAAGKRFDQSGTGKMATGMALSMGSQYAPEEMRGAMALGGSLSMLNPRLGLAVAGVGGALKAKSVGAGMAAGAVGGASIGSMFGAQGAVIGAGIGALVGGISGFVNKGKVQLAESRAVITSSLNNLFGSVLAAASGKFKTNKEAMAKGESLVGKERAFKNVARDFIKQKDAIADFALSVIGVDKMQTDTFGDGGSGQGTRDKDGKLIALTDLQKQSAQSVVEALYNNQRALGLNISEDDFEKMNKDEFTRADAANKYSDKGDVTTQVFTKMEQIGKLRFAQLAKDTGKSEAELELLAQTVGVDLYDATKKYEDQAKKLGAAMVKTADEMNNALIDAFLNIGNKYKDALTAVEAEKTINQASQGYRDKMRDPNATQLDKETATNEYFATYNDNVLAANKGDAMEAYLMTRKNFGGGIDPVTGERIQGEAFKEGGVFSGMEGGLADIEGQSVLKEQRSSIVKNMASQMAALAQSQGTSIDAGALEKKLAKLSEEDLKNAYKRLKGPNKDFYLEEGRTDKNGKLIEDTQKVQDFINGTVGSANAKDFTAASTGLEKLNVTELDAFTGDLKKVAEQQALDYTKFSTAVSLYTDATTKFFQGESGGPDWWKTGLKWDDVNKTLGPPDTSSPRGGQIGDTTTSKLSQTMSRHQAMDSQLAGKRTVTSAWRDTNLGSINSDHVTGRAYDLTGQGLGQYSKLVHSNGGFAEFHGSAATRHLHVVPGPGPGVGDASVPSYSRTTSGSSGASGGVTNTNSITINGANQSPEAIAAMVVAKLNDRDRQNRERR